MKTTGKLIDIFGDSFSCPCCKYNSDETWLEILEKKIENKTSELIYN